MASHRFQCCCFWNPLKKIFSKIENRLIFFVDPCGKKKCEKRGDVWFSKFGHCFSGLFHDLSETNIVYKPKGKTKSKTVALELMLQQISNSYPKAFPRPPPALTPVTPHSSVSFPYNPWFYFLDLSVYNYNIYAQSHVFPYDPFYEGRTGTLSGNGKNARTKFMTRLQNLLETTAAAGVPILNSNCIDQGAVVAARSISCVRGPDIVSHMVPANTISFGPIRKDPTGGLLDPILTRYSNIDPSRYATVSNEGDKEVGTGNSQWRFYVPPRELSSWKRAYVAFRGFPSNGVRLQRLPMQSVGETSNNDIYIFEGVSGATTSYGSVGQIGFIVVRRRSGAPNSAYDVDISWRGSRSGAAGRAGKQSLLSTMGNPDWVSDLYMTFRQEPTLGHGKVHAGYARTIRETMPILLPTLRYIHNREGRAPSAIYVTGHSMGGGKKKKKKGGGGGNAFLFVSTKNIRSGLATLFVKAMTATTPGSFGEES
jgi:hypothetical protein